MPRSRFILNNRVRGISSCFVLVFALHFAVLLTADTAPTVKLLRVPDGGIQQQVATDGKGTVHMVYFKGDAKAGNLFYVHLDAGKDSFSAPIRVNSQDGSSTAMGTIRGPQLAVGKGGRVHVVWNGTGTALPKGPMSPDMPKDNPNNGTPFLYARLNDAGTAFEEQRNLMQFTYALDGGGSVAADEAGNVYAVWHAEAPGGKGETDRMVYVAASKDEGKTFGKEAAANPNKWGACGCCSLKAYADSKGTLYIFYRTAKGGMDRDMDLMISRDKGKTFQEMTLDKWNVGQCVMSSAAIIAAGEKVELAWETKGQVLYTGVDPKTNGIAALVSAPGAAAKRKHPTLARTPAGETLFVWTEGTGWQKGGKVAWQVYDKTGKVLASEGLSGNKDGVPTWGMASAAARADGSFVVIY